MISKPRLCLQTSKVHAGRKPTSRQALIDALHELLDELEAPPSTPAPPEALESWRGQGYEYLGGQLEASRGLEIDLSLNNGRFMIRFRQEC